MTLIYGRVGVFVVAACGVLLRGDWDDVRVDLIRIRLNWLFDVSLSISVKAEV